MQKNPNPGSRRMAFQWKYVNNYMVFNPVPGPDQEPQILNIGCADDPLEFETLARHVDIDDWSYKHKFFTQANVLNMPFPDQSYELVIAGDIMEHVSNPERAALECCRVCRKVLVFTIFEEWRLPGHGQFIEEGRRIGDIEAQGHGFATVEAHQQFLYPMRRGFDEKVEPHVLHINQFNDEDIKKLSIMIVRAGFKPLELLKAEEATHEGHTWSNWLLAFERTGA